MGFKYKYENHRKILIERPDIVAKRIKFLKCYLKYKADYPDVKFIFLDETWIYKRGSQLKTWVHDNMHTKNYKATKFEGQRFTVLHAGSSDGFINGCSFLLHSTNNDRDYHKTMDSSMFKEWVLNQFIPNVICSPNLSKSSKIVVIMDNASYHSVKLDKPPTKSSNKTVMQEYLTKCNIAFDPKFTKKDLWDLIQPTISPDTPVKYEIDYILKQHGIDVLRLPPYHCQYNAIELAWAHCKRYYNQNIHEYTEDKNRVTHLWLEALNTFDSQMWKNSIRHCEELILADWHKEIGNFRLDNIPPVIISLADSDTDETDDDERVTDDDVAEIEGDGDAVCGISSSNDKFTGHY
ncbi:hypothetical protein Zmor_018166 [Zophobas morio]|uniref:Tc1-like transposase DDE domain-containing protein n=1 Tax=Zophobas morio TaxID=2755281 RepID=A0AA38MDB1_9CUCU|nr:hypothetical protein Zmor_018166 [Zophobas morio]